MAGTVTLVLVVSSFCDLQVSDILHSSDGTHIDDLKDLVEV